MKESGEDALEVAKDSFIAQWGAVGSSWGINRTMAQIHALLIVSPDPLSTDDVMERLKISRGNAHNNLKELIGWGLVQKVVVRGERKEYYQAEKDVWKIFCLVTRERRKRELDPVASFLGGLLAETKGLRGSDAKAFRKQVQDLEEFTSLAGRVMDRVASSGQSRIVSWSARFLK